MVEAWGKQPEEISGQTTEGRPSSTGPYGWLIRFEAWKIFR